MGLSGLVGRPPVKVLGRARGLVDLAAQLGGDIADSVAEGVLRPAYAFSSRPFDTIFVHGHLLAARAQQRAPATRRQGAGSGPSEQAMV